MDDLCDSLVEEILLRLPLKNLIRIRAAARRYNDLALGTEFAARHWQLHSPYLSNGVFLHHARRRLLEPQPGDDETLTKESNGCFLATSMTLSSSVEAEPAFPTDLASLLPDPNAREMAYLQRNGATIMDTAAIVHSSAGLLLCRRGPAHYYVCDPVAHRCVRLPELPRPPTNEQSGLLSVVAADEDGNSATAIKQHFQVVLLDKYSRWGGVPAGGSFDLEVFSSTSGEWTPLRLPYPPSLRRLHRFAPPSLGQSGTAAYCLGLYPWGDHAIAYSYSSIRGRHSVRRIEVPCPSDDTDDARGLNRCIGERRGGGLRYAHFDGMDFQVWDSDDHGGSSAGTTWTKVHAAAVRDVLQRSPGAEAFFRSSSKASWCSVFTLLGFDPADENVFLFQAPQLQRLARYSMEDRTLSFRCQLMPGVTFAPSDMFPYGRQSRTVGIPGMQYLTLRVNITV